MLVTSRVAVPVGVIPWPETPGRATVVVKLSFEIKRWGTAVRADRPDPLTPDTWSEAGVLMFPSDFARAKAQCDVLVVGRALTLGPAPAKLKATGFLKVVDQAAALGPVALANTGPPQFRAQYAPIDQRVPPPRLPLRLRYEREEDIIEAFLPGPIPQVGIVRRGKLTVVPAPVDTLALDPDRKRVMIAVRVTIDELDRSCGIVVDEAGTLPDSWSADGASWQTSQATVLSEELLEAPPSAPEFRPVSRTAFIPSTPPSAPAPSSTRGFEAEDTPTSGRRYLPVAGDPDNPVASLSPPVSLTPESDAVDTVPRPRSAAVTRPHGTAALLRAGALPLVTQPLATGPLPDPAPTLPASPLEIVAKTQATEGAAPLAVAIPALPFDATLRNGPQAVPLAVSDQTGSQILVRPASKTVPDATFQRSRSTTLPFQRSAASLPIVRPSYGKLDDTTQIALEPRSESKPAGLPFAAQAATQGMPFANLSSPPTLVPETAPVLPFRTAPIATPPFLAATRPEPTPPLPAVPETMLEEETADVSGTELAAALASIPFQHPAVSPRSPLVPPAPVAAPPLARGFDLQALDLSTAAPSPPQLPERDRPAAVVSSSELSLERYTAIRAEIWANKEPRRDILKRHGLTELKWRMAERRLSDKLAEDKNGASVAAALATLLPR